MTSANTQTSTEVRRRVAPMVSSCSAARVTPLLRAASKMRVQPANGEMGEHEDDPTIARSGSE